MIISDLDKMGRWKQYIDKLFDDERPDLETKQAVTGPDITLDKLEWAIRLATTKKTTGSDEIQREIIKLFENTCKKSLLHLFNKIYEIGYIPTDWLLSIFVIIHKKVNAKRCSHYRAISLMSHVLKIFLRISRVYQKIEEELSDTQFRFRNNLRTREALFSIQVMVQRWRDPGHLVLISFINFEKAFDWVKHTERIAIFQQVGIDDKVVRILKNYKLKCFGHVMSHPGRSNILQSIMQGKIFGKRGPGRRRTLWLRNIREWLNRSSASLFYYNQNDSQRTINEHGTRRRRYRVTHRKRNKLLFRYYMIYVKENC